MSLLPQGAGYATILGGGVFFGVLINLLTFVQKRYTRYDPSRVDEFSSASRSVKTGLLTVGVTSAWVWGAVFLQTGTLTYLYGVSLPWWFACGGFVEIAAFSFVSSKIKVNAGGASTFLQVARVRFGTLGHVTFMVAALIANFVVGSEILVGGTGVIAGMTGISVYAAVWLLPFVIVLYVLTGGLRATFVADYLHCCILFTCLLVLVLSTYVTGDLIGSPGRMYELLQEAAIRAPVAGNAGGSYTTFKSDGGMYYAVTATTCFFGLSFLDQSYWQRAIAAKPAGTSKAFAFAGCLFFSIAFGIGSSMGLAARALENNPAFPAYPNGMTGAEIGAGLAGPFASVAILGKAGAAMYLIIGFMATTSAFSSQLVAVSTIVSFDVYKQYVKPHATNSEVMLVNHSVVVFWAIFMAGMCSVWLHIGLDLNWLFYFMGVATSPAVVPVGLMMCWSKLNKAGAVGGIIAGQIMGIIAWVVAAKELEGVITQTSLTANDVIIAGALSGLGTGAIVSIGCSLIAPASFDFALTRSIGGTHQVAVGSSDSSEKETPEVSAKAEDSALVRIEGDGRDVEDDVAYEAGVVKLEASQSRFRIFTLVMLLIILVLIPAPLAGTGYIYSKGLFTLQCVAAATFLMVAIVIVIFWPLVESLGDIRAVFGRVLRNERVDVPVKAQE